MATTRGRFVRINRTVFDQADFFEVDGFTRIPSLTIVDLTSQVFFNNVLQPWPLVDGASTSNTLVAAGSLYFHEIPGTTGNYSLRFRPNSEGYWRVNLVYAAVPQILAQDYDVTAEPVQVSGGGLRASFVNC